MRSGRLISSNTKPTPMQAVEQVQVAEQQIDRHQRPDRGHHFGREHPHQEIFGPLARRKGHRPGGGNGDEEAYDIGADRQHDRIVGELQIVRSLLNLEIILERPVEEQEFRRHRDRVELALEARQERPENREEDQEGDDPGEDGDPDALARLIASTPSFSPPDSCR